MQHVKAAMDWHQPPTALVIPHSGWTDADRDLAVAYRMYLDELCPCGCGFPRHRAWDDDMDGWYEAEEITCYARQAREQWERDQPDGKRPDPGTLVIVKDTSKDKS